MKPITFQGRLPGAAGFPLVCAPLVARTREALLREAAAVAAKKPDLLEWRVDFFEAIGRSSEVVELAGLLRETAGLPLLFTRRHAREGGEPIALAESAVVALYEAVCAARVADLVDFESANDRAHVQAVRSASGLHGIGLVLSSHDFQGTPPQAELERRLALAVALGADVAKLAVMPRSMQDVLVLLSATQAASEALPIPVVTMAMGAMGAVTRMAGWAFGSALSFGVGQAASAPGQMPIEDLRAAIAVLRRAGSTGAG